MNRANHMNSELKKTEKGEIWIIKWKEMEIREFIGPGLPKVTINKIQQHQFNPKSFNVLVKKDTPRCNLTLYDGFSFWCGCGEIDYDRVNFWLMWRRNIRIWFQNTPKSIVPSGSIGCITRRIWWKKASVFPYQNYLNEY